MPITPDSVKAIAIQTLEFYSKVGHDNVATKKYLFSLLEIHDNHYFDKLWYELERHPLKNPNSSSLQFLDIKIFECIIIEFCDKIYEALQIVRALAIKVN